MCKNHTLYNITVKGNFELRLSQWYLKVTSYIKEYNLDSFLLAWTNQRDTTNAKKLLTNNKNYKIWNTVMAIDNVHLPLLNLDIKQ